MNFLFSGSVDRYETGGARMVETLPLIIHEEEQLVLDHRATQGSTKHVPAQGRAGKWRGARIDLIFPAIGIQYVIPKIFPDVAVKAVGPRLEGYAHDPTLEIAEFC